MTEHRARKRFGQNFLHDAGVIERILQAFHPHPQDTVVEIGPGLGALTRPLLARLPRLHVIELDRDLAARLRAEWSPERLTVHEADALRFDFTTLATAAGRLRIIGNLPYNISTPLLFHLLDQAAVVQDMLFMLQREVVLRMAAAPDTEHYGRLSVMLQWRCAVERLFDVGSGAFRPAPKVDSSIVRLVPRPVPAVAVRDPHVFARVVQAAFSQRRKTLRNTLRGLVDAAAMERVGVDPARRAETLSLEEFARLADASSAGP